MRSLRRAINSVTAAAAAAEAAEMARQRSSNALHKYRYLYSFSPTHWLRVLTYPARRRACCCLRQHHNTICIAYFCALRLLLLLLLSLSLLFVFVPLPLSLCQQYVCVIFYNFIALIFFILGALAQNVNNEVKCKLWENMAIFVGSGPHSACCD